MPNGSDGTVLKALDPEEARQAVRALVGMGVESIAVCLLNSFENPAHELLLQEIVRAENGRLRDSHGRTYVDLESGVWCTPIGHGHPRWLRVLAEQSRRIAHTGYCYSSPVVDEAAREILALLGFDDGRCVFLCSGSEAVEYGVRIARTLSDRPLLLTMTDSYFGAYGSASLKRADEWFCAPADRGGRLQAAAIESPSRTRTGHAALG